MIYYNINQFLDLDLDLIFLVSSSELLSLELLELLLESESKPTLFINNHNI